MSVNGEYRGSGHWVSPPNMDRNAKRGGDQPRYKVFQSIGFRVCEWCMARWLCV